MHIKIEKRKSTINSISKVIDFKNISVFNSAPNGIIVTLNLNAEVSFSFLSEVFADCPCFLRRRGPSWLRVNQRTI